MKRIAFILFITTLFCSNIIGQSDHLKFRFANTQFDKKNKTVSADIQMWSSISDHTVYAMNARFFFEDEFLTFQSFSDFKKGYSFIREVPTPIIGGAKSANKMFNSVGSAGYINAGIELKDPSLIGEVKTNQWIKLAQVNFLLKEEAMELPQICPSLIWDRGGSDDQRSFLKGSVGAVASILSRNLDGAVECKTSECSFENMNWRLTSDEAPFGITTDDQCITLSYQLEKNVVIEEYEVKQNSPNPFAKETIVKFTIPKDEEVELNIFDLKGQLLISRSAPYKAGQNELVIDDRKLSDGTYLYQIKMAKYTSDFFKMIKIGY